MGTTQGGERILIVFISLGAIEKYKFNQGGDWFWHVICLKATLIFLQGVRSMESQQFIAKYTFHIEIAI